MVVDGSFVHDVGDLLCNITNWGLIGSRYSAPSSFSHAPSCRYPGENGAEHLWAGGLWVGAVVLGERLVSTGQFESELRPTSDPLDTIYRMAMGDLGGARYPEPLPDDDGDGIENEDPKNGLDDDGDGLIDEDFAAIGEQHFRCVYTDLAVPEPYPDHVPLGVSVVQQTFQWSDPGLGSGIGFEFTIRNVGPHTLQNVYLGFFADCDIGMRTNQTAATDDMAGWFDGWVAGLDGTSVRVQTAYMYDDDGDGGVAPGYLGAVLLDHTVDPSGTTAPPEVAIRSVQFMRGMASFDNGGDPTNDSECYELLSVDSYDAPVAVGRQDDYRMLVSSGPFPFLEPGQELAYRLALVAGEGLSGLLRNAAAMIQTHDGAWFDRDGDPATGVDGREYHVRWLRPQDVPVPIVDDGNGGGDPGDQTTTAPPPATLRLRAHPNPANPRVSIRYELPRASAVRLTVHDARGRLVRTLIVAQQPAGVDVVVWDGLDGRGRPAPSGAYEVMIVAGGHCAVERISLVR